LRINEFLIVSFERFLWVLCAVGSDVAGVDILFIFILATRILFSSHLQSPIFFLDDLLILQLFIFHILNHLIIVFICKFRWLIVLGRMLRSLLKQWVIFRFYFLFTALFWAVRWRFLRLLIWVILICFFGLNFTFFAFILSRITLAAVWITNFNFWSKIFNNFLYLLLYNFIFFFEKS